MIEVRGVQWLPVKFSDYPLPGSQSVCSCFHWHVYAFANTVLCALFHIICGTISRILAKKLLYAFDGFFVRIERRSVQNLRICRLGRCLVWSGRAGLGFRFYRICIMQCVHCWHARQNMFSAIFLHFYIIFITSYNVTMSIIYRCLCFNICTIIIAACWFNLIMIVKMN